jgi:NADP-dependent alcohol dehydrogenase
VDAYVHVMEQYLTYPVGAMVQDRFAEGLLQTLLEIGPKVLEQPQDYHLRANLMWTATMALNGLIGVGVPQDWSTHMIGHQLTALYGLDHAQTLAIVLPAVMQQQREQKREKLLQYANRVFGLSHADEERQIDEAISHTRQFFEQMGVPTRLADYGIGADAVAAVVSKLQEQKVERIGEHGDMTLEVIGRLLQKAV